MKGNTPYDAGYCDGKGGFVATTEPYEGIDLMEYMRGYESGVRDARELASSRRTESQSAGEDC